MERSETSIRSLEKLPPTEPLDIENGLTLTPRLKFLLTVCPSNPSSITKPINEWQLKRTLIDFFKASFSVPIPLPEEDLTIRRFKDLKKRKRLDPLAHGTLFIRDLSFINARRWKKEGEGDLKILEEKFLEWRKLILEKMDGIELNLEATKYKLSVTVPRNDDFEGMKREWEDHYAFGNKGSARGGRQQPDTIFLKGVPSRWFAEPRVSSKPSMLVTHTIFSTFGKIRHLNVAEDDDLGKDSHEDKEDIVPGLDCKIAVQFEKHRDFYTALRVLCGRSLQKAGTRLKADYEVTWEKECFFLKEKSYREVRSSRIPTSEAPTRHSYMPRVSTESNRWKRFKE